MIAVPINRDSNTDDCAPCLRPDTAASRRTREIERRRNVTNRKASSGILALGNLIFRQAEVFRRG